MIWDIWLWQDELNSGAASKAIVREQLLATLPEGVADVATVIA